MNKPIILDTGPLGKLVHPRPHPDIMKWIMELLVSGSEIIIPEIADYELRRNLIAENLIESIKRLDELESTLTYLPLNTKMTRRASEMCAYSKKQRKPIADPKELNGDVILAAQTEECNAVVVTENVGHLSLFVEA